MRRFSQRNSLVTLNDINITPLLDLAFVLLIIFVITTPLLDKGLDLNLPKSNSQPDKQQQLTKNDIRVVEINSAGGYAIKGRLLPLNQLIAQLSQDFRSNPNLVVYIRADGNSHTKDVAALLDGCNRNGITRYSLREQPGGQR